MKKFQNHESILKFNVTVFNVIVLLSFHEVTEDEERNFKTILPHVTKDLYIQIR